MMSFNVQVPGSAGIDTDRVDPDGAVISSVVVPKAPAPTAKVRSGVSVCVSGSTTRNDAFVPCEWTVRQSVGLMARLPMVAA
ncbi:MAG: hypothetical protein C0497_04500 [Gemmatimonas sp.]|nr:hypothetical protein [Gemmatimonas sp.]